MRTPPCYDCCQRYEGCHGKCDLYQEYKEKKSMRNPEEREFADYLYYAILRMKGARKI